MKSLIVSLLIVLITSTIALYISVLELEKLNLHIERNQKLEEGKIELLDSQMSKLNILINQEQDRVKKLIPAIE